MTKLFLFKQKFSKIFFCVLFIVITERILFAGGWNIGKIADLPKKVVGLLNLDGAIYTPCKNGVLYKIMWSVETHSWIKSNFSIIPITTTDIDYSTGSVLCPKGLYISDESGNIFMYELSNGTSIYLLTLPSKVNSIRVAVSISTPGVYAGCDNGYIYRIYFSSPDSQWKYTTIGNGLEIMNELTIGDARNQGRETIYAACYDKWIYEEGKRIIQLPSAVKSICVGVGRNDGVNRIYAVSTDNNVYEITYIGGTNVWDVSRCVSLGTETIKCITVGRIKNDNVSRLYVATNQMFREYTYSYTDLMWILTDTFDLAEPHLVKIEKNLRDIFPRLYVLCLGTIYEVDYGDLRYDGRIYAYDGLNLIKDVKIEMFSPTMNRYYSTFSDWNGYFNIFLTTSVYNIKVSKENYQTQEYKMVFIEKDMSQNFYLSTIGTYPNISDDMVVGSNIFNPSKGGYANIIYNLKDTSDVKIKIYTIAGDVIRKFEYINQPQGTYKLPWDGKKSDGSYVSAGIYFIYFETNTTKKIEKVVVIGEK